ADAKDGERIAIQSVDETLKEAAVLVASCGLVPNVAGAVVVRVARIRMVDEVRMAPLQVGREGEKAGPEPDEVVELLVGCERAMTASVSNDEGAHGKQARQDDERDRRPVRD